MLASVRHRGVVPSAQRLGLVIVHRVDEETLVRFGSREDHRDSRARDVHPDGRAAEIPVALLRGRRVDAADDAGVFAAPGDRTVRIDGRDQTSATIAKMAIGIATPRRRARPIMAKIPRLQRVTAQNDMVDVCRVYTKL